MDAGESDSCVRVCVCVYVGLCGFAGGRSGLSADGTNRRPRGRGLPRPILLPCARPILRRPQPFINCFALYCCDTYAPQNIPQTTMSAAPPTSPSVSSGAAAADAEPAARRTPPRGPAGPGSFSTHQQQQQQQQQHQQHQQQQQQQQQHQHHQQPQQHTRHQAARVSPAHLGGGIALEDEATAGLSVAGTGAAGAAGVAGAAGGGRSRRRSGREAAAAQLYGCAYQVRGC